MEKFGVFGGKVLGCKAYPFDSHNLTFRNCVCRIWVVRYDCKS